MQLITKRPTEEQLIPKEEKERRGTISQRFNKELFHRQVRGRKQHSRPSSTQKRNQKRGWGTPYKEFKAAKAGNGLDSRSFLFHPKKSDPSTVKREEGWGVGSTDKTSFVLQRPLKVHSFLQTSDKASKQALRKYILNWISFVSSARTDKGPVTCPRTRLVRQVQQPQSLHDWSPPEGFHCLHVYLIH